MDTQITCRVRRLCQKAVDRLASHGVSFVETELLGDVNALNKKVSALALWELRRDLPASSRKIDNALSWEYLREQAVSPDVGALMEAAEAITESQYRDA